MEEQFFGSINVMSSVASISLSFLFRSLVSLSSIFCSLLPSKHAEIFFIYFPSKCHEAGGENNANIVDENNISNHCVSGKWMASGPVCRLWPIIHAWINQQIEIRHTQEFAMEFRSLNVTLLTEPPKKYTNHIFVHTKCHIFQNQTLSLSPPFD